MSIRTIPFMGWPSNLCLANDEAELVITLDVGPRILSYRHSDSESPLMIFEEQAGQHGEAEWCNRGGHRLWLAPEAKPFSYFPDNAAVTWEPLGDGGARLTPPPETTNGVQKQLDVSLSPVGSGVTLVHRVINIGKAPVCLAPWALTVMAPGGTAILPQPPLGQHPRDLLPNRRMVLWPYTDLSDPRFRFGQRLFTLQQDTAASPTKIGLATSVGWAAYAWHDLLFVKRFAWIPGASYPDEGCNFEAFTNACMLELESLGPMTTLEPGETVEHTEAWELRATGSAGDLTDDDTIAAMLA